MAAPTQLTPEQLADIRIQALQVALAIKNPGVGYTAGQIVTDAKLIEQYLLGTEAK